MKKKALSLLLALALCLTLLPTAALAVEPSREQSPEQNETTQVSAAPEQNETTQVSAAPEQNKAPAAEESEQAEAEEPTAEPAAQISASEAAVQTGEHTHYLCGGKACTEVGSHSEDGETTFDKALSMNADGALTAGGEVLTTEKVTDSYSPAYNQVCYRLPAGNYYLDGGITLDYPLYVPDKAEVKLCLNGNSITANGDFDAVLLCLGALDIAAPFTLTDCKGEAGKYGQITHASGTTGSGVYAYAYDNGTEARFDMFGGEISGNTAEYGGGVRLGNQKQNSLRGYFNLYGGTITNNKATENGGGVYTGGRDVQFNLYGGEISNNTAKYGGGICASNGSVTMAGGTVSGNEAVNGGGVVVNMGGGGTTAFNMSSGEITGNKASYAGGGVYLSNYSQYNSLNVSGAPKITGNKSGGKENNVYLDSGMTVTVSGELSKGASIGVTTEKTPREGDAVKAVVGTTKYTVTETDKGYFSADAGSSYDFLLRSNFLLLKPTDTQESDLHIHPVCGETTCPGHTVDGKKVTHTDEIWTPLTMSSDGKNLVVGGTEYSSGSYPTAGSYYLADDLTLNKELSVTGEMHLDLHGHKITVNADADAIYVNGGNTPTFTLCDCSSGQSGAITHGENNGTKYTGRGVYNLSGTVAMYGGNISGNEVVDSSRGNSGTGGGGVYNANTFRMYGGTISGNTADGDYKNNGGGVYNARYFYMYGGTISGNTASFSGGGVCNDEWASFYMYGKAEITGNSTSGSGGGVWNSSWFAMYGKAEITGNSSVGSGGGVLNISTFTMSGNTKITGNNSKDAGGGVYSSKTITMSGSVQVKDNVQGGTKAEGAETYTGGTKSNIRLSASSVSITTGGLTSGASIGVTTAEAPAAGTSVTVAKPASGYTLTATDRDAFTSDAGYTPYLMNGNIVFASNGSLHEHPICGETCGDGQHESVVWTDVSDLSSITAGTEKSPKYYRLTADVKLSKEWNPADYIVLDLCGHTITQTSTSSNIPVIGVNSGKHFTLTDCKGETGKYGKITHASGTTGRGVQVYSGEFTMYGGSITGNAVPTTWLVEGGGVLIGKSSSASASTGGSFHLYGGEITNNNAQYGAGVYVGDSSRFYLHDGTIRDNETKVGNSSFACKGAGVYVKESAAFTMSGGAISSNWAYPSDFSADGGGVYVLGTFTLTGGSISGNTANTAGGGVYVGHVYNKDNTITYGMFKMSGGTVSGNRAWSQGGGVYVAGTFEMSGGEVKGNSDSNNDTYFLRGGVYVTSGTFQVSGTAKVYGNVRYGVKNADGLFVKDTSNEKSVDSNVYLSSGKTFAIGADGLKDGAEIHVRLADLPDTGRTQFATGATAEADYNQFFTCDNGSEYVITRDDTGNLYFGKHQHNWEYTVSEDGATITAACKNEDGSCPNANGGSVMLKAPAGTLIYTGKDQPATLENTLQTGDETPTIRYSKMGKYGPESLENGALPKDADTYTASITVGSQTVSVEYTIEKADLTVTANNNTITYGDEAVSKGVKYKGFVDGEDESVLGGSLTYTYTYSPGRDVGLYIITPGGLTASNYEITIVPGTLTVKQREVTLTWYNTEDRSYGDMEGEEGYVYALAGNLLEADKGKVYVLIQGGDVMTVGTHTATATGLTGDKADNYKLPANVTKEYTIGLAKQTLTFEKTGAQSVTYGDAFTNAASNNRADGGEITYTSSNPAVAAVGQDGAVTIKSVGTTTITATAAAVDGKYTESKASYELTVNAKPITVTVNAVSRIYGEENPTFTATVGKDALVGSDTLESLGLKLSTTATASSNAGSYDVTGTASNKNYTVTVDGAKKLTVTSKSITVTVDAVSRIYGDANPTFTATVAKDALVGSDTLESLGLKLSTTATATSNAGSYDVTGTASNGNYTVTVDGAKMLTVNAKPITVTVDAVSRVYGDKNPSFTATAPKAALVGSDTIESLGLKLNTTATATSNAGSYDVTGTASNKNYTVTVDGAKKLTVTKKAITVTAENKTSRVGQNLVALTYTYAPALVGSDAFTGALATNADKDSVNTYQITQGTLKLSDNYTITFQPGTYTVTSKLPQTDFRFEDGNLSAGASLTKTYGDTDFTVAAIGAVAGSSVSYTSGDKAIATVDNTGKVHILKAGTVTITAKAAATADYAEATVSYTLTVNKKTIPAPTADSTVFTYNGKAQTYTLAENEAYTITGNTPQTKANEAGYPITVALKDKENTQWEDGSTADKTYRFVIGKKPIPAPAADTKTYIYNGEAHTYELAENEAYTITGITATAANEAGHIVTVALNDTYNTKWEDGSTENKTYLFQIKKAVVTITVKNKTAYVGSTAPDLSAPELDKDYTVEGLFGEDALGGNLVLSYPTEPDMTQTGSAVIRASGAEASDNYTIQYVDGELSIAKRSSSGGSTTYPVNLPDATENGTVTVDQKNAAKGSTVTITVKADTGYQLADLTAQGSKGSALQLTDKGNGQYSFTMPGSKVDIQARFVKIPMSDPFTDISADDYYYDAVKWAAEKDITGGTGNGLFSPDAACTRAQIVTFLWRAAGSPAAKSTESFSDVAADAYYAKAVAWAVENGIAKGISATTFSPDATCTRAQGVTFLFRAAKASANGTPAFRDVSADAYYAAAVKWATDTGITKGTSETTFSPDDNCTRAQIVTFLYRLYAGK